MNDEFTLLTDRINLIELVNRFGVAIDLRDWEKLQSLFLNPTEFDYSSIGVRSGHLSPEEIANTACQDLSGFQATQHSITNHQISVEGDSATCVAHVRAMHFLPNDRGDSVFEMGGYYKIQLFRIRSDWKIGRWKFIYLWSHGNNNLFKLAQAAL
jgi:hypothetical protein